MGPEERLDVRRIGRHAARGLSAKEIAVACELTERDEALVHQSIYEKLGVHNRTELTLAFGLSRL